MEYNPNSYDRKPANEVVLELHQKQKDEAHKVINGSKKVEDVQKD